jgi:hypothetical protein
VCVCVCVCVCVRARAPVFVCVYECVFVDTVECDAIVTSSDVLIT